MGIFYTSPRRVLPEVRNAIEDALRVDPKTLSNPGQEASQRTLQLDQAVSPQFNWARFAAAAAISVVLLLTAIWLAGKGPSYSDISKDLMTSFTAFSGIVLGLLGGEAQKST